jgi:hypothetical protein
MQSRLAAAVLGAALTLAAPAAASGQVVTAAEREALVRLLVERGGRADDLNGLLARAEAAAARGLPAAPLLNKIREGLAKGYPPQRIDPVVQQLAGQLDAADRVVRDLFPARSAADRSAAVTLVADAFAGGVTADEVRELHRAGQAPGKAAVGLDAVASASRSLAFVKDARLPASDGIALLAEALRHDYRPFDLLDVGREVKRREADYASGRASLRAVRDAIARGDRPEQLFRDVRPAAAERPVTDRPATAVDRPQRPARPETPQRPDRPERPGARE